MNQSPNWPNWVEELESLRRDKLIGRKIHFFQETDSTNRLAREFALEGAEEGRVILAESQSRGKGRLGRFWHSPPGVNLYASIILKPPVSPAKAPQITLLAGVATARGLARAAGLEARIKWPNDIFIGGKKVAGILAEMEAEGGKIQSVILGIGVNVNWKREDVPPDLQETATSLRVEGGRELSRGRVAAEIFEGLEQAYALFLKEGFSSSLRAEWNRLSWLTQKWVTVTMMDQRMEGRVLGLDTDGALLLQDREGKTERFIAGDVSLRS